MSPRGLPTFLRIALAQVNVTVGDLKGNAAVISSFCRRAAEQRADIVAFPELALTGYPPEDLLLKKHFVQDNLRLLKSLSRSLPADMTVLIGCVDQDRQGNLYNALAVIQDGCVRHIYHKQALPNYGVFDEKRYFEKGEGSSVLSLNHCRIGVHICEDIWVEDGAYAAQVQQGAQILINISSSPYHMGKLRMRHKLLKARARATGTHICYVNLVGGQDELVFDGGSLVVDPAGQVVAMAKPFDEDLLIADIPYEPERRRASGLVVLNAQSFPERESVPVRKDAQGETEERVRRALVTGIRDYVGKNGFQKVVIGLSGGIDSALVAVLAVEALGREHVVGVTMPSPYTSAETLADARQLARNLQIPLKEIPIKEIFRTYLRELTEEFEGLGANETEENIQARIRGNLLMALSNKFGWLVLTTGNKSEFAVGYCTLYGDMSGGFAVLKDVSKTLVYDLSRLCNREGELIPESIISRPPTAELRSGQKDQDTLPEYALLDAILDEYILHHRSSAFLCKKYPARVVEQVIRLVDRNEYKRRQSPPGVKISPRAFGRDWRLPITNRYRPVS